METLETVSIKDYSGLFIGSVLSKVGSMINPPVAIRFVGADMFFTLNLISFVKDMLFNMYSPK